MDAEIESIKKLFKLSRLFFLLQKALLEIIYKKFYHDSQPFQVEHQNYRLQLFQNTVDIKHK